MIKRLLDISIALTLLLITLPIQAIALYAIYRQDKQWPIFSQPRAARGGGYFNIYKMRTMVTGADKLAIDATASDTRITPLGAFLRRCKLDELPQLWNVLIGDMSLVGPRPQIKRYVDLYTREEFHLLDTRPGITDFSSIVFSDQAEILEGSQDPNQTYLELIRPWKSKMGLFYNSNHPLWADIALLFLTAFNSISRRRTLACLAWTLQKLGAPAEMVEVAGRTKPLTPSLPPGAL
jgi:lipopolysaccharide/colanic/teichoic acid biosynthesis glycosyltransferase